jgi:hypothetical protein
MKSVWLACWCSWDYDFHEEPRYAFKTEADAQEWIEKQPEGWVNMKQRDEGWDVMEVEFA